MCESTQVVGILIAAAVSCWVVVRDWYYVLMWYLFSNKTKTIVDIDVTTLCIYILLDIIAPLARSVLNALSISKCWSHYYHDDDGVKPVGVKSSEPWDASKWPTAKRRTL